MFVYSYSVFSNITSNTDITLFAPEHSLKEIRKYSSDIIKKSKIPKKEFEGKMSKLKERVYFVPLEEYSKYLKEARKLSKGLSGKELDEFINDIDFFALALRLKLPIWTNDKLFCKQSEIIVFNTKDIILLLS